MAVFLSEVLPVSAQSLSLSVLTAYRVPCRGLLKGTARGTRNADGCGRRKAQNLCPDVGQAVRIVPSPELSYRSGRGEAPLTFKPCWCLCPAVPFLVFPKIQPSSSLHTPVLQQVEGAEQGWLELPAGTLGVSELKLVTMKTDRSLGLTDICLRNGTEGMLERRKLWRINHYLKNHLVG